MHNLKGIKKIKQTPFFFILGRPRSGTTLLMTLLDASPATIIPVECPVIKNLYPKYGKKQNWTEKDLLEFYSDLTAQTFYDHYKFTDLNFDFDSIKEDLLYLPGKNTFGEIIKVVYSNYKSVFPKEELRIIGDKNPDSSNFINTYLKIFPEAKYVHITRDYRDHIMSVFKAGFDFPSVAMLAFRWKMIYKLLERVRAKHPEKFVKLRYEDLVSEPEQNLKLICNFLGIEFSATMLHHEEFIENRDLYPKESMAEFQKSVVQPITNSKLYNWKNKMPAAHVKIADMMVGKHAEIAGYERVYLKRNLNFYLVILLIWLRRLVMLAVSSVLIFLPNKTRIRIRYQTSFYTRLVKHKQKAVQ